MSALEYRNSNTYRSAFTYRGNAEIPPSGQAYKNFEGVLNQLNGSYGLGADLAANQWAGVSGLPLLGALNRKNGTYGLGLNLVCNQLAGTSGLYATAALNKLAGNGGS
jgi:hypothetical protein